MRPVNAILMLLMILFVAVQYNDPDGKLWMALYAIPAVWTAIAVFKHTALGTRIGKTLLGLCLIASCFGIYWFWPDVPGWWQQAIWWETETAREGMGMMIIAIVLAIVWFTSLMHKIVPE